MKAKTSTASSLGPLVDHVVLIIKENHTYDNYFGTSRTRRVITNWARRRILRPVIRTIAMKRG